MASVSNSIPGFDDLESLDISPAEPRERDVALALLLTGRMVERERTHQVTSTFLQFADQNRLDLSALWLARQSGRPVAAALVVPSAGRTGMLFISPIVANEQIPVVTKLAGRACGAADGGRMRLLQALLEPGQHLEMSALGAASFTVLANLLYMQRRGGTGGRPLTTEAGEQVHTWSETNRKLFGAAISASYEDTLDCPGLLGKRAMTDIIEGHQASGRFVPGFWFTLTCDEQPAAVMMLADLPQRDALELVYLGVAAPFRKSGLARRLLDHAFHLAQRENRQSMLLAVDELNTPATRLYQSLGFQKTARKTALIYWVD